jgi:hypothetical protein
MLAGITADGTKIPSDGTKIPENGREISLDDAVEGWLLCENRH